MKVFKFSDSFTRLYMSNQPRLVAYARKFVPSEQIAADLVQDSFLKLWETYKDKSEDQEKRIIFRIVRNACLDYLRHQKTIGTAISSEIPSGEELLYNFNYFFSSTENDYLVKEGMKEIRRVMDGLPPKCRRVFELSRLQNKKNREIADELGISVKTVEKHIRTALRVFEESISSDSSVFIKILVLMWVTGL